MLDPKQTSFVFIPGKNWRLSLAELVSFFEARSHNVKIAEVSKSFTIIETEKTLDPSIIDDLGGVIKIGRVISHIPSGIVKEAFLHRKKVAQEEIKTNLSADSVAKKAFKTPPGKCVFGVSLYFDDRRYLHSSKEIQRFIGSYFKDELLSEGTKAKFMGFPKDRQLPQLTHIEVLKKGLIEKSAEILFCIGKEQAFLANTVAVHNPFEFQKRDTHRPFQRKIFSIPPRLAKIMVNLSLCLSDKVLLDPFCGVGTILQEAMLLKAHVIGMEISPWCVEASRENLSWLQSEYKVAESSYKILLGDSRSLTEQVDQESVDCIATEPDLGPALRHLPTEPYAFKIVEKIRPLFYCFLEEAYEVLKDGGRLVLVTPYIKTRKGNFVSLNIEEKAAAVGFQLVYPFEKEIFYEDTPFIEGLTRTSSFVDLKKEHKIGREIHVLQK
jgi:tRNA G10  N-methylase Trm11